MQEQSRGQVRRNGARVTYPYNVIALQRLRVHSDPKITTTAS